MRRKLLLPLLVLCGIGLSGCWDHRYGHDRPGYPSDHHGHGGRGDHDHGPGPG